MDQIRIAATFGYDILGLLTLFTRFTHRTTALLSEMYIFCVRVGFEIQIASYLSKHASKSLSDRPFYAYSVLKACSHYTRFKRASDSHLVDAHRRAFTLAIRQAN